LANDTPPAPASPGAAPLRLRLGLIASTSERRPLPFARPRGMEENALFEAGRKEDAFLRLRNFGFPDYLRRASIRTMLGP